MWPKKKAKAVPHRKSVPTGGSTAEVTVHANGQAEGSNVATATDGIEMNTAEVIVHVNGQAEGSNVTTATDGIETNTAVTVGLNGAESPEADNPTVREKSEISLPSSRKLSTRRSRRTRRNVPASNSGTDVEIVVHGCEGDAQEVEPGNNTFTRDKTEEEEEENEVLQLQDRLMKQREEGKKVKLVKVSTWGYFVHVKWPKVKRRVAAVLSWRRYELWRSHMKYILGNYGSGAYSYYNFLRWLFFSNLLFAVLILSFIIIPQFVWRATEDGRAETSRRLAARTYCLTAATDCPGCQFQELCDPAIVINSTNSALYANSTNSSVITVTQCTVGIALIGLQRDVIRGNFSDPEWYLCPRDECPRNVLRCFSNILSGEGLFADSELFIGWYTNTPIRWPTISAAYDMPMAYLLTASVVYGLSLILIVIRIGASFKEQYTNRNEKAGKYRNVCNSVFTGWDFNITQKQLAELRSKSVKRKLQELSSDVMERSMSTTVGKTLLVVMIRIVTNTFVFLCLIAGGVAIFYSVQVEIQQLGNTSYLSTAVITLINLIYPAIFGLLIKAEMYQKSRHALFMTLLRLWTVRFYSYFSLLIAVTTEIQCTQPPSEETGGQCSISFSIQDVAGQVANTSAINTCPVCWETVLGQKFYFNAIVNVAVSLLQTVGMDTLKNIVSRCKCMSKLPEIFAVCREFEVPEGIIDLIEIQIIFWLGFFFAPMICVITVINLFLLFYVKRYSMQANLTPSKELYLAARKDLAYLLVLLITGLICLLPVGYTIANLVPSAGCGPFRELGFFYNIMNVRINELRCIEQKLVTTFLSPGFLAPLFLFLVMVIIGLIMVLRAKGTTVQLLVKQLKLESDDKAFLHNLLNAQGIGSGGDVQDEANDVPTNDLTDGPCGRQSPSSPKLPSSTTNLINRSPVLSVSSLQGTIDFNTMSRARQMRVSQESSTLGRAVMQFNQEAKKEASHGRKESSPGRKESGPGRIESSPGRKESSPGRKESGPGRIESSPGRKESSPGRIESSPGRTESGPGRKESSPGRKESGPGRKTSSSSDADDISSTLRARRVKEAATGGRTLPDESCIAEEPC